MQRYVKTSYRYNFSSACVDISFDIPWLTIVLTATAEAGGAEH